MENLSGQNLKGYELQERIGSGGFGAVYRAYQSTVHREVAIKIILPGVAHQPDFVRRFEMEAQLVARLEHMNIVPLYDYWRDQSGAYLVMRWLRGGSLRDRLEKGACSIEEAAHVLSQITSALATAHRQNVIHRDLKPANILLDEDGNAYLTDFGIAKDNNNADGSITEADVIVGSLDYISPEQARSEPVTPRTDIYSLGVVLYEMLMGEHPFRDAKSTVERLYKHLSERLPDVTNLPGNIADRVNAVIQKATAKDPAQRYADTIEFGNAFIEAARLQVHVLGESVAELITPREQEVLQLMMNNLSNKEIAERLVVSVNTVKYFQKQIYNKLRVRNRVQAITRARELDLVFGNQDNGTRVISSTSMIAHLPEPQNPYKGLQAFQAADSQDFYGREHLIEKIIKRMGEKGDWSRFLAIVGPSGSGKSSVVKAGVIPALWRGELKGSDRWFIAEMIPGTHPLEELEIALAQISTSATTDIMQQLERDARGLLRAVRMILPDDGSELVLVIDQFEEVFTLVEDEQRRAHFLQLLFNAVSDPRSRIRVLITLRADFYDRPLHYADFGDMLRARMETILPLSAAELEQAIVIPAKRQGMQFEDGLVAAIISSVNYQPGALPLLQYALTELFERREKRTLTHAAYQAIGGTVGALAKRADQLYLELDETGRDLVRQIFLRLVTLGEHNEDTRRRTPRSELLALATPPPVLPHRNGGGGASATEGVRADDLLEEIIDTYAGYRLLSLDNDPNTRIPTVEVAHEAILSEWKRLKQWINESREDIEMQQQITYMAAEWYEANQETSYLVSGLRLEQMEAWAATANVALTPIEQAFLQASITERDERKAAEQVRKEREAHLERRAVQQLRLLVATFAIAALVGGILSVVAFTQRNAANDARATSDSNALIAQQRADEIYNLSLVSAAQEAIDDSDTSLALSLAVEAAKGDTPPPEAYRMLNTLAQQPGPIHSIHEGIATAWVASWDSRYVAIRQSDGSIDIVEITGGEIIQTLQAHSGTSSAMQFNHDNTVLAEWQQDFRLILWDIQTGERFDVPPERLCCPGRDGNFMFVPDNHAFLTTGHNSSAILTDAHTGETLQTYSFANEGVTIRTLAVHPDGQLAAAGGLYSEANNQRGAVLIWNIATGETISRFDNLGLPTEVLRLGYFPDGTTLWVSNATETLILDATSGEVLHRLRGQIRQQFVPAANHVITDYRGGTVWNLETGQEVASLGQIENFHILSDGRTALIGTANSLQLWDVNSIYPERFLMEGHQDWVMALAYSPDGRMALSGGGVPSPACPAAVASDTRLILWDTENGTILREMTGHEGWIVDIAFSPDGRYALSASFDGVAILWDLTSGTEVRRFSPYQPIASVAFSPDGHTALVGTALTNCPEPTGEVILWDVETGAMLRRVELGLGSVGVRNDGQLAVLLSSTAIRIVDIGSGEELNQFDIRTNVGDIIDFAPDGQTIFLGDTDGYIIQQDITTGEEVRRIDTGGPYRVGDISVSPDGKYLIIALARSDSGGAYCQEHDEGLELVLWNLATEQPVRRWNITACASNWLKFSPDSQMLMVGSHGEIHTYLIGDQPALEWIRANRYIRDFTCEERQQYRIEPLCAE